MDKQLFIKVQATLEARVCKCQFFLKDIHTTDDLKKLTIAQAQELQRFCKQEEAFMTKLVQCDLYHIIGMGDLTPPQMVQFVYLVKDYLQYRGTVKTLAMNFNKLLELPGLPVTAIYHTHCFDSLTLVSGPTNMCKETGMPYRLSGNVIMIKEADLDEFLSFWSTKSKTKFLRDTFLSKANSGAEYGGVQWAKDSEGNFLGDIKASNVQMLFTQCFLSKATDT